MYKLNLPELNAQKMSTKDRIVFILSKKWPLSTKKLYNTIKKHAPSTKLTYQAVHKSIKELLGAGVLIKEDKGYRLSTDWINNIKKFIDEIDEEYYGLGFSPKKVLKMLEKKDSITIKMTNIEDGYDFWNELEEIFAKKDVYNMCRHDAYPLIMMSLMHKKKDTGIKKFYQILGGNGPIDKWVSKKYIETGSYSTHGVKEAESYWALLIVDDYIFEDFVDDKLKKKMWELFENIERPGEFNAKKFYELIRKPTKYVIQVTKNPEIAEMYKRKIRAYLKKAKVIKK